MLSRLVILSDLWGTKKSAWINLYIDHIASTFDIKYYDCCELGNIHTGIYSQESLHQQFITSGVENAAKQLIQLEKEPFHVLAFSIGGTIAWKAALLGLPLISLHAVSATRLRYETTVPDNIPTQLYFGMNDIYKPSHEWLNQFDKDSIELLNGEAHEMYQKNKIASLVSKKVIQAAN